MTIDERLEAVARSLDTLTKIHLDNDRGYRERLQRSAEERENAKREFRERLQRLADAQERNAREIRALGLHIETFTSDVQTLSVLARQDGENIRAPARIAESREHRLDRLEK